MFLKVEIGAHAMTSISIKYLGDLHTQCQHKENGATIETDAPKDNEGKGEDFSPTDLLATSLGSCMLTIMGIAARKRSLALEGLHATVEKIMVAEPKRRVGKVIVNIHCATALEPATKSILENAALSCPVSASLHPDIQQEIKFHWTAES